MRPVVGCPTSLDHRIWRLRKEQADVVAAAGAAAAAGETRTGSFLLWGGFHGMACASPHVAAAANFLSTSWRHPLTPVDINGDFATVHLVAVIHTDRAVGIAHAL